MFCNNCIKQFVINVQTNLLAPKESDTEQKVSKYKELANGKITSSESTNVYKKYIFY